MQSGATLNGKALGQTDVTLIGNTLSIIAAVPIPTPSSNTVTTTYRERSGRRRPEAAPGYIAPISAPVILAVATIASPSFPNAGLAPSGYKDNDTANNFIAFGIVLSTLIAFGIYSNKKKSIIDVK